MIGQDGERAMQSFTCLFTDDRYTAPTLTFYMTGSSERAIELARSDLAANPHYAGFELSQTGRLLHIEGVQRQPSGEQPRSAA
jgi:hypothetical protein